MIGSTIKIAVKRPARGDDGHKVFSIRVSDAAAAGLDRLAAQSGRSRNELINIFIEWGLTHSEIEGTPLASPA